MDDDDDLLDLEAIARRKAAKLARELAELGEMAAAADLLATDEGVAAVFEAGTIARMERRA